MNNFKQLALATLERYKSGGVLPNDYVEITSLDIDGANDDYIEQLKQFQNSKLNIRVSDVRTKAADNADTGTPDMFDAVIGLELANGIYKNKLTIPTKNLKVVGYNIPKTTPEQFKDKREVDRDGSPEVVQKVEGSDIHVG